LADQGEQLMKKSLVMILIVGVFCFGSVGSVVTGYNAASASQGKGLCRGSGVIHVLVLGTDNKTRAYQYGLADSIMVFRIDFDAPEVTVMSLPRDLWVQVPGIKDELGIDHVKLNMAY